MDEFDWVGWADGEFSADPSMDYWFQPIDMSGADQATSEAWAAGDGIGEDVDPNIDTTGGADPSTSAAWGSGAGRGLDTVSASGGDPSGGNTIAGMLKTANGWMERNKLWAPAMQMGGGIISRYAQGKMTQEQIEDARRRKVAGYQSGAGMSLFKPGA